MPARRRRASSRSSHPCRAVGPPRAAPPPVRSRWPARRSGCRWRARWRRGAAGIPCACAARGGPSARAP
uniref:Uncharacterized protein n=1 Tax=Nitratidesulfovibrio vulgaris TaxID=881 RepID=Q46605_NITVL|nr:hypothetical protein [Desulfovibrio vulgaris] [Nitratidesulfovibrio vulgaris str. 'Miyazaki F']